MSSFCTLARPGMKVDLPAVSATQRCSMKAGVSSGCISARSPDVKEWIHIDNCCRFGLPTSRVVGHSKLGAIVQIEFKETQ
jgi:hypothetical protein